MDKNLLDHFKEIIINDSLKDKKFRDNLLENPRVAIEEKYGVKVPDELEILILNDTEQQMHIVLPSVGKDELSEQELTKIAGGGQDISSEWQRGPIGDWLVSLFKKVAQLKRPVIRWELIRNNCQSLGLQQL